jgi:hypothetical protein
MRRRWVIVLALASAAACIAAVALLWPREREREPLYQGRKLSQSLPRGVLLGHSSEEAHNLIESFGTNALPWLVEWMGYDPPGWKGKLYQKLRRPVASFSPVSRMLGYDFSKYDRAEGAMVVLCELGNEARPAIPDLAELLRKRKGREASRRAIFVLRQLGRDAVPPLVAEVKDRRSLNRVQAVQALEAMRDLDTSSGAAVRALAQALVESAAQTEWKLAEVTARALGELVLNPEISVPALTNAVCFSRGGTHSARAGLRMEVGIALGRFAQDARAAVPVLVELLTDPEPVVQDAATLALRDIAPEVLEQAAKPGSQNLR